MAKINPNVGLSHANLQYTHWSTGQNQTTHGYDGSMFTIDYLTSIGTGKQPGHARFGTFGRRSALSTAADGNDCWEGTAAIIPLPSAAGEQMTILCANAADALGGAGLEKVDVMYLDANGIAQTEVVTLNGASVNTTATNLRFINFFHGEQAGSTKKAVGNISIHKLGDPSTVYSIITPGGNRALTASLMIPANKKFYCTYWRCTGASSKPLSVRYRGTSTDEAELTDFFLYKDIAELQDSSGGGIFSPPLEFPSFSIVKSSAFSLQAGGSFSSGFGGWIE